MKPLLTDALEYRERGWSIVPMTITARGKRPGAKWKTYQTTSASEKIVRGWFESPRVTGIGVIFGAVSGGLASRDFDEASAYHRWAEEHAKLAMALPTVKTPRGYHVYFRAAEERYVVCGDGEYRGDAGHLSVLPPSLHPKGARYEWKIGLPERDLLLIDPVDEGLAPEPDGECNREDRDNRDNRAIASVHSVDSVNSVHSVHSVHSVLSVAWTDDLTGTLPSGEGQRHASIFRFARALKARPEFADATPGHLDSMLREWHRRALPRIATKEYDETRIDFINAWDNVMYPLGTSPVEETMRRSDKMNPPATAEGYDSEGIRRLATLCAVMQENAGTGVFYLSCRTAATVLGVKDHTVAWRWLGLLRQDRLLIEVEKGTKVRASRWKWAGGVARAK